LAQLDPQPDATSTASNTTIEIPDTIRFLERLIGQLPIEVALDAELHTNRHKATVNVPDPLLSSLDAG
jgi:hypothetical protein